MKFCIIVSELDAHAPLRIKEEVEKSGHSGTIAHWEEVVLDIKDGKINFSLNGETFNEFDFIIPRSGRCWKEEGGEKILKDYTFLLRLIAQNEPFAEYSLLNADYYRNSSVTDKLTQQFFFALNNLPGIDTIFSGEIKQVSAGEFPFIIKTIQGSKGDGVEKIENKEQELSFVGNQENNSKFFIKQRYYKIDSDYRVLVLGDKILGGIRRMPENKDGWKTNFSAGGVVEKYEIDPELKEIAIKTAKALKMDYVGIDFLKDSDGTFRIIETNALAQFEGFESVNKEVNVAKEIIDFLINK